VGAPVLFGSVGFDVVWALYNDPNLMEVSGQTLISAELADAYGITDNRDAPERSKETP
jgi:hypothetical protein